MVNLAYVKRVAYRSRARGIHASWWADWVDCIAINLHEHAVLLVGEAGKIDLRSIGRSGSPFLLWETQHCWNGFERVRWEWCRFCRGEKCTRLVTVMVAVMMVMVCDGGRWWEMCCCEDEHQYCVVVSCCHNYNLNYCLFVLCGTCNDVMAEVIIAIILVVSLPSLRPTR